MKKKQVYFSKEYIDIVPDNFWYTRSNPYYIPVRRLHEDWLLQLRGKVWWNIELEKEFLRAIKAHKKKWGTGNYGKYE